MNQIKSYFGLVLVLFLTVSVRGVYAQSGFGTGSNISKLYAITDAGTSVRVRVTDNGALQTVNNDTVNVSLDDIAIIDPDGDTWNVRADQSGEVYLTGEAVNIATDTELNNLQSLVDSVDTNIQDTQPRRLVAEDQNGNLRDVGLVDSDGDGVFELEVNNQGKTITTDNENDTTNNRLDYVESSPIHNAISPNNSTTISFSEPRYRVSVTPHNGEIRYSYTNSADTNSVPVVANQRVDNSNLNVSQITIFVPSTETSAVDVTVEVFD